MDEDRGSDAPEGRRAADRLLLQAARRGGGPLALLCLTALAIATAELALPAVLGGAVDAVVAGDAGWWPVWAACLVGALVTADAVDDVALGTVVARSTAWLRMRLLAGLLAGGPRPAQPPPGDVAGRMVANAAAAGKVAPDLVRGVVNLVPAAGAVVALALIDPWLCATFAAGLPLLLVVLRTFLREATQTAASYLDVQGRIAARLVDALAGARTIAAAGTAGREAQRVLGPLPLLGRHGMGMWRAQVRLATQDALLLPMLEVLVLAVAGLRLAGGHLTPGELLAAGQYVQLASTVGSAGTAVARLARARAGAARVAVVLATPPMAHGRSVLPAGDGRLELHDVTVRAGGRAVLDRVSLTVPGGALVAVVGRSGAGKSLLAAVAGRLLDPDAGTVALDGVALAELSHAELHRQVAHGFERPALLGDTVGGAIAFGGWEPTPGTVVAAARAACADPFIRRLPDGYGTALADAPMSGGETQRVGLARCFAHAGRLLVLDDVAASLDTVTEHRIGEVLTGPLGGRTRLVVAHRAATAARADLVVWLEGGRVRAVAPHTVLWADPAYRAVFGSGDAAVPDPMPVGGTA